MLFVDSWGNTEVVKTVGTPWDLFDYKPFNTQMLKINKVMMGHNRAATKGAVNRFNAHPFEFENIIGAHNGTLRKQHLLDDHKGFEVDSENLYHHMELHGLRDTVAKLCGAYALTWYDKSDGTMNFIRNDERSFYYTFTEDRKTLFWASEHWMLNVALGRHDIKHGDIIETQIHKHYRFEVPGKSIAFDKTRVSHMEPYKEPPAQTQKWQGHSSVGSQQQGCAQAQGNQTKKEDFSLVSWVAKEVVFRPKMICASGVSVPFIMCTLASNPLVRVRVYAGANPDLWLLLESSLNKDFVGKVKAFNASGDDGYLIIDQRTILKVDDSEEEEFEGGKYYPVRNGLMVSTEVWYTKTKKGCAWCSSPVIEDEAEDLYWMENEDFLCKDCQQQDEVKEFINVQ